jgi:CHAT domain-containing protein
MLIRNARVAFLVLATALIVSPSHANQDPVWAYILAADSVNTAAGIEGLASWMPEQPDLGVAAAARLVEEGVQVGDSGNAEGEAGNIALVEAMASAIEDGSAVANLLAEYRSWDARARSDRAQARAREDAAWSAVGANPDSSLAELEAADAIYARIGDSHSRARVRGRAGAAYWYLGDADAVLTNYQQALELRRTVEDRMLEGATLNGLGSAHYRLVGDLPAAIEWYARAAELRRSLGDAGGLATSLTYKANVHRDLGQMIEARELFEEARPVLEQLGNTTRLVENVFGTALLYRTVGRSVDAMRLFDESIALCSDSPDCVYGATIFIEKAELQLGLGMPREALTSLDEAERLLAADPDPASTIRMWEVRSLSSMALGDQDAARDQMVRALQLAREVGDPTLMCDTSTLLAQLYLNLGAIERGRAAGQEALELAIQLGDAVLERNARFTLGWIELEAGNGAQSVEHYSSALALDEAAGDKSGIIRDLVGRGGAHSQLGRPDEARADLRRAINLQSSLANESHQWLNYQNMADTFEQSHPDSAAYYYDAALASLERANRSFGGEAFNTGYLFAKRGKAYEEITRYYARQHLEDPKADNKRVKEGNWAAKAFETAERSRARGLLDLLNSSFALDAGPEALALIDSLYEIDSATAEGRAQRARIEGRLAVLRAESRSGSAGTEIEPVGLLEFRKEKPSQALVLQYAVGDSATILFAVDNKLTVLFELPGRAELRRRVKAFRDAIAQPGAADAQLMAEGRDLYRILLEPVEQRIGRRKHLVIVPDDVLFELPFEALLTADPIEGAPWSEQPFFARQHRPVYAPSSTVYLRLREQKAGKFQQSLLAIGDVDFSALDRDLEPLPFTRSEVEGIPHKLKEDQRTLLLGDEATELRLRTSLSLMSSRVVHLATHGLIDPAEPMASSVVLGPEGDDDGFLHALEILAMDLDRPMIVLSACESALGRLERGEGVVGLTRSFLAAGARGVVASLWPVADESTATLMSEFYYALWRKYSAAESLRQARMAMLDSDQWSHPYYWAPFIALGTEKTPW